jgi:hypothetical protein
MQVDGMKIAAEKPESKKVDDLNDRGELRIVAGILRLMDAIAFGIQVV